MSACSFFASAIPASRLRLFVIAAERMERPGFAEDQS
jgi:hypothetical protein